MRSCGHGEHLLLISWLFDRDWPVWLLAAIAFVTLLGLRQLPFLKKSAGKCLHDVKRHSYGDWYSHRGGHIMAIFQGNEVLFIAPLLVLTLADATAAVVGSGWGRLHYQTNDGAKSWEGVSPF